MTRTTRSTAQSTKDDTPTTSAPYSKKPRAKKISNMTTQDMQAADGDEAEALHAITVQEPFASAIIHGSKRLENRKFRLAIQDQKRGRWVAIHAGKSDRCFKDGTYNVVRLQCWPEAPPESTLRTTGGKILGLAHFSACVPLTEIPDTNVWKSTETCSQKMYGWIIDRVVPLERPVEHSGQLGLWRVKEAVAIGLWEQAKAGEE
ncbi:hypothetical protein BC938DRAFT_475150 [Jimgerdemannia flammicorona]|uniref:PUA-like domain-containing protein n=1 Tax=Jimgerdemannia flammicorona TaxID=994334 RepID=A0A433QRY3_9FUNG|nr:hypothetical protein BC938DRAFT_475150 [Jimgerdemannia flammicorona]